MCHTVIFSILSALFNFIPSQPSPSCFIPLSVDCSPLNRFHEPEFCPFQLLLGDILQPIFKGNPFFSCVHSAIYSIYLFFILPIIFFIPDVSTRVLKTYFYFSCLMLVSSFSSLLYSMLILNLWFLFQ